MEDSEKRTIGIVGGMGPEATAQCFESLVDLTEAEADQDHLPVLVFSNPGIPDRTNYIVNDGKNPLPYLRRTAKRLKEEGAEILIMPCNTAHHFINELRSDLEIVFLDMIGEALNAVPKGSVAGLLATDGTLEAGIYQDRAEERDIDLIFPGEEMQSQVMKAIYDIKAAKKENDLKGSLLEAVNGLKERGAEFIISGCTELRIVLRSTDIGGAVLIRPIDEVVKKAIRLAGGRVK